MTVSDDNQADNNLAANYSYSPDGVTIVAGTSALNATIGGSTTGGGGTTGQVLQLFSFSKPPGQGNVTLTASSTVNTAGISYAGGTATVPVTAGQTYLVTPGENESGLKALVNGTQSVALATGTMVTIIAQGSSLVFREAGLIPAGAGFSDGAYTLNGLQIKSSYDLVWGANETYASWGGNETNSPGPGQISRRSGRQLYHRQWTITAAVASCHSPGLFGFRSADGDGGRCYEFNDSDGELQHAVDASTHSADGSAAGGDQPSRVGQGQMPHPGSLRYRADYECGTGADGVFEGRSFAQTKTIWEGRTGTTGGCGFA